MKITVYDTTLRDGMQGEGMSLSAEEKVRVAHALDGLGVDLIEAGFPASNPKEEALFELLARESFEKAGDLSALMLLLLATGERAGLKALAEKAGEFTHLG